MWDGYGGFETIPEGRKTTFVETVPENPTVFDVLGRQNFDEYGNVKPLQREHLSLPTAYE